MTSPAHPDFRRVAVIGPGRRLDLAVPGDLPIADLLPDVLGLARIGAPDIAPGWELGRIGGSGFDTDATLDGLEVRDGDVLLLRPARQPDPLPVIDEITDVAAAVAAERGTEQALHGRRLGLAVGAAVLIAAVPMLWAQRHTAGPATSVAAGVLALAAVVTRRLRGPAPAPVLGLAALGYAAAAVSGLAGVPPVGEPLLIATLSAIGTPVLAAVLGTGRRVFTGVTTATVLGMGVGVALLLGAGSVQVAAGVLVVATCALPWAPRAAAALGRLPHPGSAPADDDTALPRLDLADLTAAARRAADHLTGVDLGLAVVIGLGAVVLAGAGGLWPTALAGLALATLLLRARAVRILDQSVALAGPAVLALVGGVVVLGARLPAGAGPWLPVWAVILAGSIVAAGLVGSRRAWSPTAHRAARAAETVVALAIVPVAVGVLDGYGMVRHR